MYGLCSSRVDRPACAGRDAAATRASQLCTLRVLGVRALTESVRAEPITEMSEACAPLACYVARLLPYLQKLLYSEHRPIHDALVADGVVTLLADMRFLQVSGGRGRGASDRGRLGVGPTAGGGDER